MVLQILLSLPDYDSCFVHCFQILSFKKYIILLDYLFYLNLGLDLVSTWKDLNRKPDDDGDAHLKKLWFPNFLGSW